MTHFLRVKYNRIFDKYKDDILRLKGSIWALEDELDHAKGLLDKQRTKRPQTCKPSPPSEMPQKNLYMATASRPAAPSVVPPPFRDADVKMKAVYLPLPTFLPPKHQALVPQVSRPVNWIPAGRLPGTLLSAIPQNTEEFNHWARAAHTSDNYPDLQQACKYIRYINEVPLAAKSPLMIHALASWRLFS